MSTAGLEYDIGMIAFRIQEPAALGTNQQGSFSFIPTGGKERMVAIMVCTSRAFKGWLELSKKQML